MRHWSIFIFLLLYQLSAFSQTDTTKALSLNREKLGIEDLYFPDKQDEISVISASRSVKSIEELPITIHVISHEEIIRNQYSSLSDILRSLPGVRVSVPGSGEMGETFQIRGLIGNQYTKMLVNGLPIKPSVVAGMPLGSQFPVRQAERIEIIYGPSSAIYGADAVSGVINIITKSADKGTFAQGDVSLGQNEYLNFNFILGGKAGKNKNILDYSFYGSKTGFNDMNIKSGYEDVYNPLQYLQRRGVRIVLNGTSYNPLDINNDLLEGIGVSEEEFIQQYYPVNYEGGVTLPQMQELPSESSMLGLHLRFRNFSFSFNNNYRRTHSSIGLSSYLYKYNNPQNFWGENIRKTTLSYSRDIGKILHSTTNISALNYKMDNNSSEGVTFTGYSNNVYRYSASNDILLEQLITAVPINNLEILTGLTYQFSGNLPVTSYLESPFDQKSYKPFSKSVAPTDTIPGNFGYNPLTFYNVSLFSQAYYSFNKFRFMGGLRYDYNSKYGDSFSPRLAALYKMNERTRIHASLGFAYKAPPSSLTYQSIAYKAGINLDSLQYLVIPNTSLLPENYMSVEMGFKRDVSERFHIDLSIYYNEIRNLILDKYIPLAELDLPYAVITSDTASVLMKENNKEALSRLYGLQATMNFIKIVPRINLDAQLSVTFAKSSESFPDIIDIAGDFISDFTLMPSHFGQLRISMVPLENFYLQFQSIWESTWLRVLIPFEDIYNELFKPMDGYYAMDVLASYNINRNFKVFVKIQNIFNEEYGGIGTSRLNSALPYNPQLRRNIRFGLTYVLN